MLSRSEIKNAGRRESSGGGGSDYIDAKLLSDDPHLIATRIKELMEENGILRGQKELQSLQEVQEGIGSSTVGVVRGLQSTMPSQYMSKITGSMDMHLKRNSGRNSWINWSGHRINNMIVFC